MFVVQVCPLYYPCIGGIETHVKEISERLVSQKIQVEVLTTDPSGKLPKEEIINGVRVKRFVSYAPGGNYHYSTSLKKYLARNSESYDIVHIHSYHDFPAIHVAQIKKVKKLVFTPHYHGGGHTLFTSLCHYPYRVIGQKIFDKADKVICVSKYERGLVLRHFKGVNEKIVVIPNGINLQEFTKQRKRDKDEQIVLYVGRLEKYKGIQYLIKILPMLNNNIFLEIVGKGAYKENLIRLAKSLHVNSRIKFFEDLPRQQLLEKYAAADLFVLLSTREAYSICVAEALASEIPCLVANSSALKEWIDNQNCFGIDYPINLLALQVLVGKVMSKEIRCPHIWDWSEVVEKLLITYQSVLHSQDH